MKTKNEIYQVIELGKEISIELPKFIEKYKAFYFGSPSAFEICYVEFEVFKYFFEKYKPSEIRKDGGQLLFDIHISKNVEVVLRTDLTDDVNIFYDELRSKTILKLH